MWRAIINVMNKALTKNNGKPINMTITEKLEELKPKDFNMNFRINKKVKKKLDKIAEKKGITTSNILRFLINNFISQIKKEEENGHKNH